MTNPSDGSWLRYLKSWPLLLAAAIAFSFGVILTKGDAQRLYAAVALLTVGTLLLGVWVTLLVIHGHKGGDEDPPDGP